MNNGRILLLLQSSIAAANSSLQLSLESCTGGKAFLLQKDSEGGIGQAIWAGCTGEARPSSHVCLTVQSCSGGRLSSVGQGHKGPRKAQIFLMEGSRLAIPAIWMP